MTFDRTPERSAIRDALGRPGRPLDPATRSTMESRFGHDFGGVRVHDDPLAARSAADLGAAAYTVGRDVVLGAGGHAPGTPAGQRLIAHELAHVVQQGPQPRALPDRLSLSDSAAVERDAHSASEAVSLGRPARVAERLAPGAVARQPQAAADIDREDDRRIEALGITRAQLIDWATLTRGDFIGKYGLRFWWNFPREKVRQLPGSLLIRVLPKEDQTLYLQPSGRVTTMTGETMAKVESYRPPSTALGSTARGVALMAGATPEKAEAIGDVGDLVSGGLPAVAGAAKALAKPRPPSHVKPPAPPAPPPPAPTTTAPPPAPTTKAPPPPTAPPKPEYTPPERQLPPHVEAPPYVPYAKNIRSRGELVVEPEVLRNFRPKARPMSAKAAGFDAHEGARIVSVTKMKARDGTVVTDEAIAGGDWIQIKGVSDARGDLVRSEVDKAMNLAAEALRSPRQNLFERTGPGEAYRTTYAGPPDKITIFVRLEMGSVTPELVRIANEAARNSVHAPDLPPVHVVIAGH